MATTLTVEVAGQTVTLDRAKLSAGDMCDIEDAFGDVYDNWSAALLRGSVKAVTALVLICGQRTNSALTLADVRHDTDYSTLRTVGTPDAPAEAGDGEVPQSPTEAAQ